jgi:hypothetical protein
MMLTMLYYLKKEKNSGCLENNFIETKGLGHSMHDDELYKKYRFFI